MYLYQCKLGCWLILSALQISHNEINEAKSQCQTVEFHKKQCLRLLAPWIQSQWRYSMTLTCVGPQVSPECSLPQRRLGTTPDGAGQNYHHGSRIILGSVTGQDFWLPKAFDGKWLLSPISFYIFLALRDVRQRKQPCLRHRRGECQRPGQSSCGRKYSKMFETRLLDFWKNRIVYAVCCLLV